MMPAVREGISGSPVDLSEPSHFPFSSTKLQKFILLAFLFFSFGAVRSFAGGLGELPRRWAGPSSPYSLLSRCLRGFGRLVLYLVHT